MATLNKNTNFGTAQKGSRLLGLLDVERESKLFQYFRINGREKARFCLQLGIRQHAPKEENSG